MLNTSTNSRGLNVRGEYAEVFLKLMWLLERTLRFGEVVTGTTSEEALVGWLARELEELGWEVCL